MKMKERVLNEDGQFESVEANKDRGMPIAELLTLEKGKSAALAYDLRDLKAKHDELSIKFFELEKKYAKVVEKYDAAATKILEDSMESDPIKKNKKK